MEDAENSGEWPRIAVRRIDSFFITIGKEKLQSQIQLSAKSAVEAAQPEDMRDIIEKKIFDVFVAQYWAVMAGIRSIYISFAYNAVTVMVYREVLVKKSNQFIVCWWQTDAILLAEIEKVISNIGFVKPVAVFF